MKNKRRQIKKSLTRFNNLSITPKKLAVVLLAMSTLAFVATQLVTNAVLSPLGHKLASLNTEKNLLLEENRELEQEIAKDTSYTIVDKYSANKLGLAKTENDKTIYVEGNQFQASTGNVSASAQ